MSRIVVFDLQGKAAGEFTGRVSRGWSVVGNPSVSSGGQATVQISTDVAAQPWLQLGRMVLVRQAGLPDWAGMLDPEWNGRAPIGLTLYNAEYLLALRTPDRPLALQGTTAQIAQRMIGLINEQEETWLRLGSIDRDTPHLETLDGRPFWDQLKAFIERSGMEMRLRPEIVNGRMFLYMDIEKRLGKATGYEYKDGPGGNMTVVDVKISRQIWNRVIGINDASTEASRLQTEAMEDDDSVGKYRLRSTKVQFRGVRELSTLQQQTRNYLANYSAPWIELTVKIKDKGEAFAHADLGNSAIFHAANAWLPGGVRGWRGTARMLAMAYDEPSHTIGLTVRGTL